MRTREQKFPCACVADLVKDKIIERGTDRKIRIAVGKVKEGGSEEEGRGCRRESGIRVGGKEGCVRE